MGGSNGVRLFYSLARRSTTSVYARVLGGGYRTFNTGIYNNSRVLGNSSSTTTTTSNDQFMELVLCYSNRCLIKGKPVS
ncbi:hypothetical protein ABKV19_002519 [Rosa sericea]